MALKFESNLRHQTEAVAAVVNCFKGQPYHAPEEDCVRLENGAEVSAFRNAPLELPHSTLLENVQGIQSGSGLPKSEDLWKEPKPELQAAPVNLDIEMETGTGKTYVYIKTAHRLFKEYGWSKFIIVVPSIAIFEGVRASLKSTADHFRQMYGVPIRTLFYGGKEKPSVVDFSADGELTVLVTNQQTFNTGFDSVEKDAEDVSAPGTEPDGKKDKARKVGTRKIYETLDALGSQSPIDVLAAASPILILDEPQLLQGDKTYKALPKFNPLFILRYSATHRTIHDLVFRLDAVEAYNRKLVKKIAVVGIEQRQSDGRSGFLYLSSVSKADASHSKPRASLIIEVPKTSDNAKQQVTVTVGSSLEELSGGMAQYRGLFVTAVNAVDETVELSDGQCLRVGEAVGDIPESTRHHIQMEEAIRAHFKAERENFRYGIKTLTLFFLDTVKHYRDYDAPGARGDYLRDFESLYCAEEAKVLDDLAEDDEYKRYLRQIKADETHAGYFSVDRKSKQLIDPEISKSGSQKGIAKNSGDYDLILRDKESLLSLGHPQDSDEEARRAKVRFIFSHSALREGWDNPNVFVICMLQHVNSNITRRQQIGRGLRLCVTQSGARWHGEQPNSAIRLDMHALNRLTVVASENFSAFAKGLQNEFAEALAGRARRLTADIFVGMEVKTPLGFTIKIDKKMAKKLVKWAESNEYVDKAGVLTETYREARVNNTIAGDFPRELEDVKENILEKLDALLNGADVPLENTRATHTLMTNKNLAKKEFQELWARINRRASYEILIDSDKLVEDALQAINSSDTGPKVIPTGVRVIHIEQTNQWSVAKVQKGEGFEETETRDVPMSKINSDVRYDLVDEIARPGRTGLTRKTVCRIVRGIEKAVLEQYAYNPELFIREVVAIINRVKTRQIVSHIHYHPTNEQYDAETLFSNAASAPRILDSECTEDRKLQKHIYDYLKADSEGERNFAKELEHADAVAVYAKLPRGFFIPTPVGNYNPDWAIAFKEGTVQHLYLVAETKGSADEAELRETEKNKIDCARAYFRAIAPEKEVVYGFVRTYGDLLKIVKPMPQEA